MLVMGQETSNYILVMLQILEGLPKFKGQRALESSQLYLVLLLHVYNYVHYTTGVSHTKWAAWQRSAL